MFSEHEDNPQDNQLKSTGNPFVSVIIPVYNDETLLRKCLQSLKNQTYPHELIEIIVVDNGSDKSPKQTIAEFDNVQLLQEPTPGSYAARNLGIAHAKGDVWAFIDSDIVASPDWLKFGVEMLYSQPNIGAVGGKVAFSYINEDDPSPVELFDSLTSFRQKEYIEQSHFSGTGNLFSLPKIFSDVGLFNKELKSGGDREWGNRVHEAGYQIVYAEEAEVYHPARNSFSAVARKQRRVGGGLGQKLRAADKIIWNKVPRTELIELMIFLRLCHEILFYGGISVTKKSRMILINIAISSLRFFELNKVLLGGKPLR